MSITDPRPPPDDPLLLTIPEVMASQRVSRRTVYNWKEKGFIAFVYTVAGSPRILASSLAPRLTKDRRDQ